MADLLKDQIDLENIKKLAVLINQRLADFKIQPLVELVNQPNWAGLPLKQRIRTVTLAIDSGFKQANMLDYQACLTCLEHVSKAFS
ncbi:MAG: hypothetical protein JXK16_11615 [Thiotrichales bacterium]|nr:hypothetical protein [Thiotrichales bacterium]